MRTKQGQLRTLLRSRPAVEDKTRTVEDVLAVEINPNILSCIIIVIHLHYHDPTTILYVGHAVHAKIEEYVESTTKRWFGVDTVT